MATDTEVLIEKEAPPLPILSKERPGFRNISGTRRTDKAPSEASDSERELTHLKRSLSAQEAAKQRAQEKVVEAQRQLKAFETETNRVRGELKRAKDDLMDAKEEYNRDLRRAVEREAGLSNELVEIRGQATKARENASGYKRIAGLTLFLLIPAMCWAASNYWPTAVERNKATTETAHAGLAAVSGTTANAPPHDITSDVQRLDLALNRFRHESAENVLRKVHAANAAHGVSVCSFEWNGGQASLLFGSQPGAGLGTSLTQCADAVEQAAKKTGS